MLFDLCRMHLLLTTCSENHVTGWCYYYIYTNLGHDRLYFDSSAVKTV
jgi:hypothetical protein